MIIRGLDIERYHQSPRVSHSKLKTLRSKGPRGYYRAHVQNSWREEDKDHFVVGRALEDALQRPQFYREHYVMRPEGMTFGSREGAVWRGIVQHATSELGQDAADLARAVLVQGTFAVRPAGMTFATKEGKAWKAEQLAAGHTILTDDDVEAAARVRKLLPHSIDAPREVLDDNAVPTLLETLEQAPIARALIEAAEAQVTLAHDKVARFPALPGVQARPDWLCLQGCAASDWRPYTLDLKSSRTLPELSSGRSVIKYGYHSQAAIVGECLAAEGIDVSGVRHFLLGAEKTFPNRWRVVELPHQLVAAGQAWCERLMAELEGYYANGEWPLVESEIVVADVPAWLDESEAA